MSKENKTAQEIILDTGIRGSVVLNTLNTLLIKEFIELKNNRYVLNSPSKLNTLYDSNLPMHIEVQELLKYSNSLFFKKNQGHFALKKVLLTEREEKTLQTMLANIEKFLDQAKYNKNENETKNESVIFLGHNNYGEILNLIGEEI